MFFLTKSANKKSLFYLLKLIVREKRKLVVLIFPLILFIACGHSLYIFALGPLLKAFFVEENSRGLISFVDLFPIKEGVFFYKPLSSFLFPREALLFFLPALIFFSAFLKNFATYCYQVLINKLSFYFTRVYRESLFAGIISKDYRYLLHKTPAKWMSIVMNDVFFLQDRIILLLNHSIRDIVVLISSVFLLFILYGNLGLLFCLGLALAYFFLSFFSKRIFTLTRAIQENLSFLSNSLLEVRKRYYTIKTSSAEALEIKKFTLLAGKFSSMTLKSSSIKIIMPPALECLGFCALAYLLSRFEIRTEDSGKSSLAFLMAFTILATTIRPLKNLGEQIGLAYEIRGAIKESSKHVGSFNLEEVSGEKEYQKPSSSLDEDPIQIQSLACGLEDRVILKAENLSFHSGKSYFIFGPSGSGKSTLLKTLVGLVPPKKWQANLSAEDFAYQSHYVAQRSYTFDESIQDIVLYGHPRKSDISKKKIWSSLKSAELSRVVKKLPRKLNAQVSSLKGSLSGGQLQRLLLSRVFLSDERVLILDEASSHLDAYNNYLLIKNLLKETKLKNKILIVVNHDVKLASLFDVSLTVVDGKLVKSYL